MLFPSMVACPRSALVETRKIRSPSGSVAPPRTSKDAVAPGSRDWDGNTGIWGGWFASGVGQVTSTVRATVTGSAPSVAVYLPVWVPHTPGFGVTSSDLPPMIWVRTPGTLADTIDSAAGPPSGSVSFARTSAGAVSPALTLIVSGCSTGGTFGSGGITGHSMVTLTVAVSVFGLVSFPSVTVYVNKSLSVAPLFPLHSFGLAVYWMTPPPCWTAVPFGGSVTDATESVSPASGSVSLARTSTVPGVVPVTVSVSSTATGGLFGGGGGGQSVSDHVHPYFTDSIDMESPGARTSGIPERVNARLMSTLGAVTFGAVTVAVCASSGIPACPVTNEYLIPSPTSASGAIGSSPVEGTEAVTAKSIGTGGIARARVDSGVHSTVTTNSEPAPSVHGVVTWAAPVCGSPV